MFQRLLIENTPRTRHYVRDVEKIPPPDELLRFGNDHNHKAVNGQWDKEFANDFRLFHSVSLMRWFVVYSNSVETDVKEFVHQLIEIGGCIGFVISEPKWVMVQTDKRIVTQIDKLTEFNPQLILFALTLNENSDLYSNIIRLSNQCGVLSQTLTATTLRNVGRSNLMKIAIQLCAKLGGAPWSIKCPLGSAMTIGFNVFRDAQRNYGSLVASLDLRDEVEFFSTISEFSNNESLSKIFKLSVVRAVNAFEARYSTFPIRIFIYRGSIRDDERSQLRIEFIELESTLRKYYDRYGSKLELVFIAVTPNLGPEMVVETRNRLNFFLPTRSDGAVAFTKYEIIYNASGLWVDRLRIWAYKHSHLYFKSFGAINVPAVLQYATDQCHFVSNHTLYNLSIELEDKLYFL